jgi:hypothetical protein
MSLMMIIKSGSTTKQSCKDSKFQFLHASKVKVVHASKVKVVHASKVKVVGGPKIKVVGEWNVIGGKFGNSIPSLRFSKLPATQTANNPSKYRWL